MKILLVPTSDWLSHPVPSRLHFIFERLAKSHEVHVARYPIPLWTRKRLSELIIHEAKGIPIRDLSLYYMINAPNHMRLFENIFKTCDIDVIVFANILTGAESVFFGRTRKIPLVFDYLDHFPEVASSFYNNRVAKALVEEVVFRITKWNLDRSNHVVTVSRSFFRYLKDIGITNVSLIPNGVDLDKFRPTDRDSAREILGIQELKEKFVIAYVGSIEGWYDLEVVARATNILNRAGIPSLFEVVGGRLVNRANNRLFSLEQNVYQAGFVNHDRLPLHISASDVCVLPLKKMAKNLTRPMKLLEYFSCGRSVLSLPNSELEREFGDALTIFHDADDLARILLEARYNPDLFKSKIEKGHKYAEENSWANHARSYERLLRIIVDDHTY